MLYIQHVCVIWTKESRGGPGAARRNSLPEAVPADVAIDGTPETVLQRVVMLEDRDFTPASELIPEPSKHDLRIAGLSLRHVKGTGTVVWFLGSAIGAPARRDHEVFTLQAGDYGRVVFNARFGYSGEWTYRKHVVHLLAGDPPDPDTFLQRDPDKTFESLAILR